MRGSEQHLDEERADQAEWAEARRRASVIERTFGANGDGARLTAADAAALLGVSRATIFRWRQRWISSQRVSSLVPRQKGRRAGSRPLDARIDAIIADLIDTFYLRNEKPRISDLMGRSAVGKFASRPAAGWADLEKLGWLQTGDAEVARRLFSV